MAEKLTPEEEKTLHEVVSWAMLAAKKGYTHRPGVSKRNINALGRKLGVKAQEYVDDR